MPIAYPNATAQVYRPDGTTLVVNSGPVNFQRADAKWIQAMAASRQQDYSQCYRCRVDNAKLVSGYYPQQGDIIFLTAHADQPDLLGRWAVDDVQVFSGPLKSRLLYCSREILNNNL